MDVAAEKAVGNAGFKVVCDQCGSLSIKLTNPANEASTTAIQCGRCSSARGTLADLQDLARRGIDIFDF